MSKRPATPIFALGLWLAAAFLAGFVLPAGAAAQSPRSRLTPALLTLADLPSGWIELYDPADVAVLTPPGFNPCNSPPLGEALVALAGESRVTMDAGFQIWPRGPYLEHTVVAHRTGEAARLLEAVRATLPADGTCAWETADRDGTAQRWVLRPRPVPGDDPLGLSFEGRTAAGIVFIDIGVARNGDALSLVTLTVVEGGSGVVDRGVFDTAARIAAARLGDLEVDTSAAPPATLPRATPRIDSPSGLVYFDIVVGDGPALETGQEAVVHYRAWLAVGDDEWRPFDSTYDRGEPFIFGIGAALVIAGWDEGLPGMRVGGLRRLIIPPDLAWGESGAPGLVPPSATLMYEVELVEILP
ncbi:MAG: FKBP-type peptidyl-prolyl cis-trans isomerase [Dehalococcoidia bacterium]